MSDFFSELRNPEREEYFGIRMNGVGMLAFELVKHFGTVAATTDGEDGASRAKLRLQTPEEVVGRAWDIAEAFYADGAARGHFKPAMTAAELEGEVVAGALRQLKADNARSAAQLEEAKRQAESVMQVRVAQRANEGDTRNSG